MTGSNHSLLHMVRNAERSSSAIADIAEELDAISHDAVLQLLEELIEHGEDKALGIALNIIAYRRMRIDPHILCRSLKVVENLDDFIYPFREQDEQVIEPLLGLVFAKDISSERNILAAALAAELALAFDAKQHEVKKALTKLGNRPMPPEPEVFVQAILQSLEQPNSGDTFLPRLLQRDIHQELSRPREPRKIGQDYTVRRPMPKIGRNAPCHCGSGKKYKKCCLEKDQELWHDASPYAGLTMSDVMASPGLVEDTKVIETMQAYQLKKVDPAELNEKQLFTAYRRADMFGLHEVALNMLLELKGRPGKREFAEEHLHDLLFAALEAGNLELSKRIESFIPEEERHEEKTKQFHIHLLEQKDLYLNMENHCRRCLVNQDTPWKDTLVDMAYCFENTFPALSIIFARAAVMERPEAVLDNTFLVEMVRNARTDLDLDPFADPVENVSEWGEEKQEQDIELESKDKEIQDLRQQMAEGRRIAVQKDRELRERERELEAVSKRLEQAGKPGKLEGPQARDGGQAQERADAAHLKRRIERLKLEIREQQEERRRLHRRLESKEKEEARVVQESANEPRAASAVEEGEASDLPASAPKRVEVPVYTEQFRKRCEQLQAWVAAKALRAAAGFAAHDADTLRQSKRLERLSSVYRVRIGRDYRLLIRWEKGEGLEVLDLIPRQELDKWIRQYQE